MKYTFNISKNCRGIKLKYLWQVTPSICTTNYTRKNTLYFIVKFEKCVGDEKRRDERIHEENIERFFEEKKDTQITL